MTSNPTLGRAAVEQFCRRWKIVELSLFGSVDPAYLLIGTLESLLPPAPAGQ